MAEFLETSAGIAFLVTAQCLALVAFVMISLLFLVYGDRKIWAAVQMRRGPNVVGVFGLLQTVADALKYVVKEVIIPAGADRPVFLLAPLTSFVLAMIAWAVIPFNEAGFYPILMWLFYTSLRSHRLRCTASLWVVGLRIRNTRSWDRSARQLK